MNVFMQHNVLEPRNQLFSAAAVNRSIQNAIGNTDSKNQDNSSISPQGKIVQMIEQLQKQKDLLVERKNKLVSNAQESGMDAEVLKSMQDVYEKQIVQIEEQISQLYAQQAEEVAKEKESSSSGTYEKPAKTKQEATIETMQELAQTSDELSQAERIHGMQEQTEQDIHQIDGQIHMSELRIENLESAKLLNGNLEVEDVIAHEKQYIRHKKEDIATLETQQRQFQNIHGEILQETSLSLEETQQSTLLGTEQISTDIPRSWTISIEALSAEINNIQDILQQANEQGLSGGERISFFEEKKQEWIDDIKQNDPELFLEWLKRNPEYTI